MMLRNQGRLTLADGRNSGSRCGRRPRNRGFEVCSPTSGQPGARRRDVLVVTKQVVWVVAAFDLGQPVVVAFVVGCGGLVVVTDPDDVRRVVLRVGLHACDGGGEV